MVAPLLASGLLVSGCLSSPTYGTDKTANGECGVGNRNFGTEVVSSTLDPSLITGWGVRTGDWQWGAAIQQQILPRVSAELNYQHRWLMNFTATDNRNLAPSDFDAFAVIVPTDSRLPWTTITTMVQPMPARE